ncbi:MAG TPA: energy transducer TonB [Pyrinomonadaceae bacterium]|nr:energy transducer TonB [Pyrinomonadaceae bacterium]
MKKEVRKLCVVALTVIIGSGCIPALAQQRQTEQTQQSEEARVMVERSAQDKARTSDLERQYFERDVIMQAPAQGDYVFLATEMSFGGLLVKGAPYSAQAVTESTQTLTDGNRIVNKSTASVYRDSEGRTRREQSLKAVGPYASAGQHSQTIFISDPVAGTSYTLDPVTQTARKMAPLRFKVSGPKANDPQTTAPTQYKIAIEGTGAQTDGKQYRVVTPSDPAMKKRQMETGMAMGWLDSKNPSARTEALGKQSIEGIEAEGTRSTVTIPAGKIGNVLPIDIVSERWYSPELQVIVMTRHLDPRFGENSYKLTNISRSEPARELFEVPAGYTVKETPSALSTTYGAATAAGTGTLSRSYEGPITGGMLNGKAISLPLPVYPPIAKQANASGSVMVQITIDEGGNVISANAVSGHPLLRAAAVMAAREAKFSPTKLNGEAVKVTGTLLYTFAAQ